MARAIRIQTTVLPGHRVEVTAPELPEGCQVEVVVTETTKEHPERKSMEEILRRLPDRPRLFGSAADVDRYLAQERD